MRLVHAFNPEAATERTREGLDRIMRLLPPGMGAGDDCSRAAPRRSRFACMVWNSPACAGLRPDSFDRRNNVTFGAGRQ